MNRLRIFYSLFLLAPLAPSHSAAQGLTAATAWNRAAIDSYLDLARTRTLEALRAQGISVPAEFLQWVDGTPIVRTTVYGCRKDPLPVLLALRSLEIDLGPEIVREQYPQLALAFAIQGSYTPPSKRASDWNDGAGDANASSLPDVTARPRLVLRIPTDPRVAIDTKAKDRTLDLSDHIINFLEDHAPIEVEQTTEELPPLEYDAQGVAKPRGKAVNVTRRITRPLWGADVIASAALQAEFNAYLQEHGCTEVAIDCGDAVLHWHATDAVEDGTLRKRIATAHELFHSAYRAKGRMPAERDAAPSAAESMAWFVRNDRHPFTPEQKQTLAWPRFPLNAPWPLLIMLAADDQPLREREEIWTRFRDHGEFRTYGEYIGGIAQQFDMQSARRVSPLAFNYGSIQMMWKDGGVCGTMGNIGARTYRICGVPASTAGQPGHCAIVHMAYDEKSQRFQCQGGQYATGGDEVTTVHAGWNYDDIGGRRPMVFHQSITWGVKHDFLGFLDTLVLRRMWDAAESSTRTQAGLAFVAEALRLNPFALAAIEGVMASSTEIATVQAIAEACGRRLDQVAKPDEFALYRSTLRELAAAREKAIAEQQPTK